ncbi:MAG: VOC family protein [Gammaproteobacteria bacterium]|nr:VOC family protein [Gammaproteobacteria bacterium]
MAKIEALAYVVAESTDVSRWEDFGRQALGTDSLAGPDGALFLKMDEREHRIIAVPGPEDRYLASGWEVPDAASFDAVLADMEQAGCKPTIGSADEAAARRFRALAHFSDPAGNRHELVWGYTGAEAPFVSPIGVHGFKTGRYGVGHTVLPALPFDETLAFYREVLGFGTSDEFDFKPAPDAPVMRIYFLHAASGRHHSVALAEMPNPAGCVHIMVELDSLTDVGLAYDRREKLGFKLMATLGEHENDKMTSFYMMTPGNFAVEYGWGGMIVDPATFQTTRTERVSVWGHDFSVGFQN